MYSLLALYARPLRPAEPVICIDEKSLQLLSHSREPLPMKPRSPAKQDYEYKRNGTTNLFVAIVPKAGRRVVTVTAHRAKPDFVGFVSELLTGTYAKAKRVHLLLDNLNTHFRIFLVSQAVFFGAATAQLNKGRVTAKPATASGAWLRSSKVAESG